VDTSSTFIPIPPLPSSYDDGLLNNRYFVGVSNERLDAAHAHGALTAGEIAALVIGIVIAFLITVAIVIFFCVLYRRKQKKQGGEKKRELLTFIFSLAGKTENEKFLLRIFFRIDFLFFYLNP
jgi:hypothetical protein